MPQIRVQTGDVTQKAPVLRNFKLEANRPLTEIVLCFDGRDARLDRANWPALLEQVRTRSLSRWKHSRMAPPLGEPDMQELLGMVGNTPAYQLFLAGFDIAEMVRLVSDLPERALLRRALALSERLPSTLGSGSLFFLPDALLDEEIEQASLDELVLNNKLCRLRVEGGESLEKYYIPYATPIGFTTRISEQTQQLWERIRDYYYAFR